MSRFAAAAWLLAITLGATPAFAQRGFVQGGAALDVRRFSGQPGTRVFDAIVSSITIGGGGFLTPIFSAAV
jgi:hypothetical protein